MRKKGNTSKRSLFSQFCRLNWFFDVFWMDWVEQETILSHWWWLSCPRVCWRSADWWIVQLQEVTSLLKGHFSPTPKVNIPSLCGTWIPCHRKSTQLAQSSISDHWIKIRLLTLLSLNSKSDLWVQTWTIWSQSNGSKCLTGATMCFFYHRESGSHCMHACVIIGSSNFFFLWFLLSKHRKTTDY